MTEVGRLLASSRVLTLIGPGGCGKTRLALQVAAQDVEAHPGGVWVADLAPITDTGLVTSAVADALGVGAVPFKTLEQAVSDHLQPLDALLVLDNCEHVLNASRLLVAQLLRECPRLVVLATSREPLSCEGEVTWQVAALSLPDVANADLCESVRLFVDRASAVRPSFRLDEGNSTAVGEICRRLDGIPLAIELAAARARALTPAQIAGQLTGHFALLTGGQKASLPRHRTLEASVDWSYALLEERERLLLRRLGVFSGGFDLIAAEAVCSHDGLERWSVMDALTGLVDRSLVQLDDRGPGRYRMLETIRQYALSKLLDSGELAPLRDRHLEHFRLAAAAAGEKLEGPDMLRVLEDLESDIDNLRAAFDWAMQAGKPVDAWGVAGPLWLFWQRHRGAEGGARLSAAVQPGGGDPLARARALIPLAFFRIQSGDIARGQALAEEVIALATEAGDSRLVGRGTSVLGFAGPLVGDPEAVSRLTRALELHRAAHDDFFTVISLTGLVVAGWLDGEAGLVRSSVTESLTVSQKLGNPQMHSRVLLLEAFAAWMEGDLDEMAVSLDGVIGLAGELRDELYGPLASGLRAWLVATRGDHESGLTLAESVCARAAVVNSVLGMGFGLWARAIIEDDLGRDSAVALLTEAQATTAACGLLRLAAECAARLAARAAANGDEGEARAHIAAIDLLAGRPYGQGCRPFERMATAELALTTHDTQLATATAHDALATWTEAGDRLGAVNALELLVRLDTSTGRRLEAARLLGATSAERERLRWPLSPADRARLEAPRADLEAAMGSERLAAALAEGASMNLKEAATYARRGRGGRRRPASGWMSLTATEVAVAQLVAEGLKNAEIATRLFVSPVTVKTHIAHAFTKLGVRNRAELAAFALRETAPDLD